MQSLPPTGVLSHWPIASKAGLPLQEWEVGARELRVCQAPADQEGHSLASDPGLQALPVAQPQRPGQLSGLRSHKKVCA